VIDCSSADVTQRLYLLCLEAGASGDLSLSVAQNSILFFRSYFLFHQDEPSNPFSILFILGQKLIHMCLMHFATLCKKCLRKISTVVSCLMKCWPENVRFNQKFDCTEEFEDLGSQGRMCNIANHALLFMVGGLHRKWKQTVAYYLRCGSTKAEMLVTWVPTLSKPWNCWVQP
jgi:hypothetical protein